ncbi:hypothetical protein [Chromobacterium phragmitis]|uniref:Uncharacterized protein n=1 Tax=Chromobacterium phragmitis TaxID=2202141 RepID=A0ABV0J0Q2_9NEIS
MERAADKVFMVRGSGEKVRVLRHATREDGAKVIGGRARFYSASELAEMVAEMVIGMVVVEALSTGKQGFAYLDDLRSVATV